VADSMETPPAARPRARELGVILGSMSPGQFNAITDVPGVRVGQVTLFSGSAEDGTACVRTGVTAIVPHVGNIFREKSPAAVHCINAFGKFTGTTQIDELGTLETPIVLTNTLSVGIGFEGLVEHALRENPEIGLTTTSVNAVVAECNDSYLNDMRGRHVQVEHVVRAIDTAAAGPVAEGVMGAGTGMVCYGWKGGIGTSSRIVRADAGEYTLGVLTLANFGGAPELTIGGLHVGADQLPPGYPRREAPPSLPAGSCIVVVATDAPLNTRQLGRIARRVQNGLARTGTYTHGQSGDYALVFSTARTISHWPAEPTTMAEELMDGGRTMNDLFQAAVEATEESVVNVLFVADTVHGRDGHVIHGLPAGEIAARLGRS
jgi:D-aminopeptidase